MAHISLSFVLGFKASKGKSHVSAPEIAGCDSNILNKVIKLSREALTVSHLILFFWGVVARRWVPTQLHV